MRNRGSLLGGSRLNGGSYHNRHLYRCFCCFHVRSGALALGTWHLMIHLFAICLLAYMSANMDEINSSSSNLGVGSVFSEGRRTQTLTIVIRRANATVMDSAAANGGEKTLLKDAGERLDSAATDDDDADSDPGNINPDEPIALPVSLNTGNVAGNSNVGVRLKETSADKDSAGADTSVGVGLDSTRIVVRSRGSSSSISQREKSNSNGGSADGLASYYWTSFVFNSAGQPVLSQRDLNLAFLLGCITVSIALMMLVGIIKGRPAYLIPFLTYQIMDLIVSCLTVAGLICYGPQLKDYVLNDSDFPFRDEVASMDSQWATLIAAVVVLSIVFIKAYFVQVVWLCLRFMKEEQIRRVREDCQPKVIYLDNQNGGGGGDSSAHLAAGMGVTAQQNTDLTMFVFDDQGNLIKKVPPPAYETTVETETSSTGTGTTAPPAYTA